MSFEEGRGHPPRPVRGAGAAPDPLSVSAPRFLVEIIAWVAAPWALARYGIWSAVLADVLLIGLPTVFGMPGAKKQRNPVAVAAGTAIALELLQPAAACAFAAAAWPAGVLWPVVAVSVGACVRQFPRWRWMVSQ